MGMGAILDEAERHRKSLVYYAPDPGDFREQFDTRNVEIAYRELPQSAPEPFVAIREDGRVRGVIAVETIREYLRRPRLDRRDTDAYRAIVDLLDDTVFASLDRRQLLLTAREFEDRAWRVGTGTLHVGFQSAARFADQRSLYRRLAGETDLDVHAYFVVDGDPPAVPGLTVHTEPASEIGRHWFMVFDGGDQPDQQFALVAEQLSEDDFYGVWTYDRSLVRRALAEVPSAAADRTREGAGPEDGAEDRA